jgi:hypothetical protein
MSDQKDKAKEKKQQEAADDNGNEQARGTGHGKSGGNMGAGQSGKEDLGSEKPSDGPGMGSHKPGDANSK